MALRTLYQTLLDSDPARLRIIAAQWDLPLRAERRADIAAELADAMANAERIAGLLLRLTPDQRAALDDLLRADGRLPWLIFTRRWGDVRLMGPGRLEREAPWRTPSSPAEGLWYWGLLQRAFDNAIPPVEWAFVPDELRLYLPTPTASPVPLPEPCAPPPVITLGDDTLADTLADYWAALQVEPRRVRHLPQRALLETLSREQGWLNPAHKLVPDPVLTWLKLPRWDQWAALARAWIESRLWHDLAHVPGLILDDPDADWPGDPVVQRRAALDLLTRCARGAWVALNDFITYVHTHAPDFLRPDGDYERWPLRDMATGASRRGFTHWFYVEGAYLGHLITGPCAALGLVDIGSSAAAQPAQAFRLSVAGEALLRHAPPPDLPVPGPITLHETGHITVPPGARYARFQVGRIADPRDAEGHYALTPSSLRRALKQRIPPERLLDFLREASGADLPAHLEQAIRRALEGGPTARLEPRLLLRINDEALLRDLQRHNLRGERVPQGLLFYPADRERLLTLLARSGWLVDGEGEGT